MQLLSMNTGVAGLQDRQLFGSGPVHYLQLEWHSFKIINNMRGKKKTMQLAPS